jgi:hypothetical protein
MDRENPTGEGLSSCIKHTKLVSTGSAFGTTVARKHHHTLHYLHPAALRLYHTYSFLSYLIHIIIRAMDDDCAIEEAARKVAAKPALKKHPLHNAVDGTATPTDAAGEDARKKKGHLKWDEEVIAEHDQLRGTRMKVRGMRCVIMLCLRLDLYQSKGRQTIFQAGAVS